MTDTASLELGALLTTLGGGLALFLYGMRIMTDALRTVAGSGMKSLLGKLTTNRFTGLLSGALVTAVIQSSSITTVLVVGFISAGLLTFSQSIGIIIGSNVGTTITAQIIAFKVSKYALLLIGTGFLMEIISKNQKVRHWGITVMGLGMIFFGMELMSEATQPLRSYSPFIEAMQNMKNPAVGILAGFVFTALVQSSSATTGIVIVLAGQGLISLEAGIALILGANVGTCVTALISALGKPREAVMAAVMHVLFNVLGVLVWVAFIPNLADWVRALSPSSSELEGTVGLAADMPRQIANAHTIFNVGNALIFVWFTGCFAALIERIVPKRCEEREERVAPLYLDPLFLEQPAVALDQVHSELVRMGSMSSRMVLSSYDAVCGGSPDELARLQALDRKVDDLHEAIIAYLGEISLRDLVEGQPELIYEYIAVANCIESMGDIVETNLISCGNKRLEMELVISKETKLIIAKLHAHVCDTIQLSLLSMENRNLDDARTVTDSKLEFNMLVNEARNHLSRRLTADDPGRIHNFRLEHDIIDSYKRLHALARSVSEIVIKVNSAKTN